MNKKKYTILIFILVALAQLYIPGKMILDREDILANGKTYKFRTAPIDPYDPFKGKYIILNYSENTVIVPNADWEFNETIYVSLTTDTAGYAKVRSVSKVKPANNIDFVKAKVNYTNELSINGGINLNIQYPFDRYYMEESKALDAELAYRKSAVDTSQVACALVKIKGGESVLKDVLIDGISIKEVVKNQRANQN